MSPFSNSTEGEIFIENRCERCIHFDVENGWSCEDFLPALLGEWPSILYRTGSNVLGVDCTKFEAVDES